MAVVSSKWFWKTPTQDAIYYFVYCRTLDRDKFVSKHSTKEQALQAISVLDKFASSDKVLDCKIPEVTFHIKYLTEDMQFLELDIL
jgi:hypothetical protein